MQNNPGLSVMKAAWMAKVKLIIAVVINEGLRLRLINGDMQQVVQSKELKAWNFFFALST